MMKATIVLIEDDAELLASLEIMKAGGSPMSPPIARMVIETLHSPMTDETFSVREIEILRLIARGNLAKEIACQLGLSTHTVYSHLKRIYGKLHVRSKAEAISKASRIGLV